MTWRFHMPRDRLTDKQKQNKNKQAWTERDLQNCALQPKIILAVNVGDLQIRCFDLRRRWSRSETHRRFPNRETAILLGLGAISLFVKTALWDWCERRRGDQKSGKSREKETWRLLFWPSIMASWWSFQTIHFCVTIKRYAIVFYWLFISWCVYNNSHSFNSAREFAKETIFDAIQHEGIRAKIRATKMRAFELPLFRAFWNSTATKLNGQLKIFLKCPVLYAMFVFRVVTGQEMVREKLNSWRSETDSFDL